ncbi:MAG TPA: hypothetical protein VGO78_27600, partial [Acidimicrobiales bacterium]|nr:hypothetical protein [Acidimicrobiales bacterium]
MASSEACGVAACGEKISPVDVFCPNVDHGDLLLFQQEPVGRTRWWVVNTLRTIVVALVVLAAAHDTPWPIYLLAVTIGFSRIWAALHAHQLARSVGLAGWTAIGCVTAIVATAQLGDEMRIVWTAAVIPPLAVLAWFGAQGTIVLTRREAPGIEREATRAIAGSYTVAAVAVVAWWLTDGGSRDRFVELPQQLSRWLGFAGLGTALGALLIAALGALLM